MGFMVFSALNAMVLRTVKSDRDFVHNLSLFAIQKGPRETKFSKGWQRLERLLMGGFSVHLVINETGEIQGVTVIKGNVDTCAKFN